MKNGPVRLLRVTKQGNEEHAEQTREILYRFAQPTFTSSIYPLGMPITTKYTRGLIGVQRLYSNQGKQRVNWGGEERNFAQLHFVLKNKS